MTLTPNQVEEIKVFCDEYDYGFRPHYTGRGMYNRHCIGIVTSNNPFRVAMDMTEYLDDETQLLFRDTQVSGDSMGRKEIVYFPNLSCDT